MCHNSPLCMKGREYVRACVHACMSACVPASVYVCRPEVSHRYQPSGPLQLVLGNRISHWPDSHRGLGKLAVNPQYLPPQYWDCKSALPHPAFTWVLGTELKTSCLPGKHRPRLSSLVLSSVVFSCPVLSSLLFSSLDFDFCFVFLEHAGQRMLCIVLSFSTFFLWDKVSHWTWS